MFTPDWWQWLAFGLLLMTAEMLLPALLLIWIGLAAMAVGLVLLALPELSLASQIFLWAGLSVALLGLWFRFLKPRTVSTVGSSATHAIGEVGVLINTVGKDGSLIYVDDTVYAIPPVRLSHTVDPTGAGDAYRGGLFAARLAGLPWEVCGRVGALCGAYALEHAGTTSHSFTLAELMERYAENFGAEPHLARLVQTA